MTLKALFYAYLLGGITFIPLLVAAVIFFTIYTSVPVGDTDLTKNVKARLERDGGAQEGEPSPEPDDAVTTAADVNDMPKNRKGWLTMRRTFEESTTDGSYVALVRTFLDARSKDPKKSRPKDMWYVVLKGKVLYLYEDEAMTECEAVIELGGHDVIIYPEGLLDGELYAKRNSICLRPKIPPSPNGMPSLTKEMRLADEDVEQKVEEMGGSPKKREREREKLTEAEKLKETARTEALSTSTPWFIFVRSNVEMEDWYFALLHASDHPAQTPTLTPLHPIFQPSDMNHLVATLDEQPDVIPMRWLNALLGRIFFSYYRTQTLEKYIIGRLMKKLSKIKRPTLLSDIVVTEVSVGNKAPTLSKPMLKELTKEGDAALEVHLHYKGEVRITIEATATINLGARFKSYTVKLVLAAVLKELEGNLLIKVKRPPSNRIWYAFTQTPRMVLEVEPIVSDRQITWSMILSTIESRLKEVIQESIVLPNMDDIAFFESSKYLHRGGIWADAARNEKPVPSVPDPTLSTDEPQSTVSAPVTPEDSTAPSVQVDQPSTLRPSRSTEDLSRILPGNTGSSTAYSDAQPFPSASGSTADDPSGYSRNNKRRSWFSTTGVASAMEQSASLDGVINERGRTSDVEDRQSGTRSQSTPGRPESILDVEGSEHSNDDPSHLTPHSTSSRRSSSHNSPIREHTKPGSFHEDDDFPPTSTRSYSSPTTPTPQNNRSSSSHQDSHAHTSPTSPGGSSFLSTLKSRAGDKQALSNSAREAMRKWGVNWGGLKKDSSSANEDMPDHGSVGSSARSRMDAATQKRASYAEVRAAVAERKNKERGAHVEEAGATPASLPIPIPEGTRNKARAASYSSTMSSSSLPGGVSTSASSSSSGKTHDQPQERRRTSSTMSRAASSIDGPSSSQEGHAPKISLPEDSPLTPPSPIHVQPQAKMMTIPGIHASHRGEVMSMGHVAARPQTPPPQESKLKNINPGIQSVYRLWKSPASASTSSQEGTTSFVSQNDSTTTEPAESSAAVVDRVPSISTSPPSRPAPPPLPPRSTVSRPPVASFTSQASASDALKSIATRDDSTRASLDRSPQGSPPSTTNANGIINRRISINSSSISNADADIDEGLNIPNRPKPNNPGPPLPPRRTAPTSA